MTESNKFIGIELLRFICSFAVLIWHYQHFAFTGNYDTFLIHKQPFFNVLSIFYRYGCYAVQLFWCISGFIFYWKYSQKIADRKIDEFEFINRRFSRLYPLHFLTLILAAVAQYLFFLKNGFYFVYEKNDLGNFFIHLLMGSGWSPAFIGSYNGPVWSVSVEIICYAFFFIICRYISPKAFTNLVLIALSLLIGKFTGEGNNIVLCMFCFHVGGLVFFFNNAIHSISKKAVTIAIYIAVSAIIVVCIKVYRSPDAHYFLTRAFPLILFTSLQIKANEKAEHVLNLLGNLTYSSYLLHFPLQLLIAYLISFYAIDVPYKSPLLVISYLLGTFLLSYFCFNYLEMPMQRLLRNFSNKRRLVNLI